jgi:hypothetical protein
MELLTGNRTFRDYIEAQANEILKAVDADMQRDPERFRQQALSWIEENAEGFRANWEHSHAA